VINEKREKGENSTSDGEHFKKDRIKKKLKTAEDPRGSDSKHQQVIQAGHWQNCVGICFDEHPSILCPAIENSFLLLQIPAFGINRATCIGEIFIDEYGTREVS
jgi:hypothetical protein